MPSSSDKGDLESVLLALKVTFPTHGCVARSPASRWDDGSIVGNGVQGALAFCRSSEEEIILSQEDMFLPLYPFVGYLPLRDHYDEIQRLVVDGKVDGAQELIRKLKEDNGFPFYNTTDPFVGAASVRLNMSESCPPDLYIRSTDFEAGDVLVAWSEGSDVFHRRMFASRADDIVVVTLSSPTGAKLNVSVGLGEIDYIQDSNPKSQNIYEMTVDGCDSTVSSDYLTHSLQLKERWEDQHCLGSLTVARVITDGDTLVAESSLNIANAEEVTLLIRTTPNLAGRVPSPEELIASLEALSTDYDSLLAPHKEIHSEMFNRCSLQLTRRDQQHVCTEDLQASSSVGQTSPALVEKAFAAGRFGIISSTGKLPPLLQGVWTGTWKPRWSGDYTLNGNVQSMVAASLSGNHYECQETLMDYLDSLMDDFRENAKELLGFRGPLIPWRSSTNGKTHYLSCFNYYHDFPGTYWFAGAGWFAQIYYDYYLYTGNEGFFEDRLKPFLLDSAALYEDYLNLEKDGKYILSPSSSPENETSPNIWMAPNATMTIAVIKELLRTCLRHRKKLDVSSDRITRWKEMLAKLPDYAIGENGALKEWTWPGIENEEGHRHASHLYPLYFGVAPEIAASSELREACRVAIEKRMEFRRPKGGFMAFGIFQLGMSAAHLKDLPLAYESVEYLANCYWSPVMTSLHNVKDVFNLDIAGGFPAVVIEMLVQGYQSEDTDVPWQIELLPCLPKEWPEGKLRGVRCRGGFELDIEWSGGHLTSARITSLRGERCGIIYGDYAENLNLNSGEARTLRFDSTLE